MASDPRWHGYYPRTKEQSERALEALYTRVVELQLTQGWIGHTGDDVLYPFRASLLNYAREKISPEMTGRVAYDFREYMDIVRELMIWERVLYYPNDVPHFSRAYVLIEDRKLILYPHQELIAWFAKRQLKISWIQKRLQQRHESRTSLTT